MKPLIGISANHIFTVKNINFSNEPGRSSSLGDTYSKAVERAGGIPVIIPNCCDEKTMEELGSKLDGLLISGGPDVDPSFYGERAIGKCGSVSVHRDATELAITRWFIKNTDKPILGICRGAQLINVAMGGSLIQDLPTEGKLVHTMEMYPSYMASHSDRFTEGTRLYNIFGAEGGVNSFHHQAVKEPAPGFVVAAVSEPDGVIEAIEMPGERFFVGVQWHPECMIHSEEHQAIFKAFVDSCK